MITIWVLWVKPNGEMEVVGRFPELKGFQFCLHISQGQSLIGRILHLPINIRM
jgi:hypothetical protein